MRNPPLAITALDDHARSPAFSHVIGIQDFIEPPNGSVHIDVTCSRDKGPGRFTLEEAMTPLRKFQGGPTFTGIGSHEDGCVIVHA